MKKFSEYLIETKLLGVKEKYKKDLYMSFVEFLKDEFNVSDKIEISVRKPSKSVYFGHIDLVAMSKGKYKLIVKDGMMSIVLSRIAHEYTHVNQYLKGNLDYTEDLQHVVWKGKEYISVKELGKVSKNYDEYIKLPWEAEAYKNQDDLPDLYSKSKHFKELYANGDDNIKFILDNIF